VTNVAAFGAFVDIGVHQDGLVHVSALADRFVRDPHEVVKAGQVVKVRVVEVDIPRKRIGLTMRLSDPVGSQGRRDGGRDGERAGGPGGPRGNAPDGRPRGGRQGQGQGDRRSGFGGRREEAPQGALAAALAAARAKTR